jgi:hypothetical protein
LNRALYLLLIASVPGAGLFAQDAPKVELFGGYAYFGLPAGEGLGLTAATLNGWDAAAKLNLRRRVGIVADFSGNYGQRRMTPTQFQPLDTNPGKYRQHTLLFGPEVRVVHRKRLNVNVRALIGAAYIDTLVLPLREPYQPPPPLVGPPQPPLTEVQLGWEKTVTGGLGGSVDYRISDHLRYRIVQPELIVLGLGSSNRSRLRVSTGIVFTFGSL